MGVNKKQILDFDLNSDPADGVSFVLQTPDGVTERTTKSALLNGVNTSLIGLQTQIDGLDLTGGSYELRGKQACEIGQQMYTIDIGVAVTDPTPIISLTVPTSASTLFIQGIYDITSTDFKVVLSEVPALDGYIINWSVKTSIEPNTISFLELTDTPNSYLGADGYLVAISGNSLYFKKQEEFDQTGLETLIGDISSSNLDNSSLITGLQTISGNHEVRLIDLESSFDLRGKKPCNIGQQIYTITTDAIITDPTPIISLTVPTSASTLFIQGVYDITTTDFKVVLSEAPSQAGYIINWSVKTSSVQPNTISFLELTDTPDTFSGYDGYLVAVSGNSLYFKAQANFDTSYLEALIAGISGNTGNSSEITGLQTISGDHENRITNLEAFDYSVFATNDSVWEISGGLQSQLVSLVSISGQHETRITNLETTSQGITGGLTQLDGRYVNVGGDTLTGTLNTTNLIPISANTYSLGTSEYPYKDLFLSDSSVYLGSNKLSVVDNRLQLNDSYVVSWQEVSISGNYTVNTANNLIIKANTLNNAIDITIATQTSSQRLKIIDVGEFAGTNIITLTPTVGTIEGLPSKTIENNGGSLELIYNDEWEISDSFTNFFNRNAATGVISPVDSDTLAVTKLFSGNVSESFTATVADFSNPEANVNQNAGGWGNTSSFIDQSSAVNWNGTTGTTAPGGAYNLWAPNASVLARLDTNDRVLNTTKSDEDSVSIGTGTLAFVLDFGSAKTISRIIYNGATNTNTDIVVKACSDWNGTTGSWVTIAAIDSLPVEETTDVVSPVPHRYLAVFQGSSSNYFVASRLQFLTSEPNSTTNTFQYRITTGDAVKVYSLPTLSLLDETNTPLVNGDILIEYSTNGSTWSSQYSLNDFKALGNISSETFWLRFEMVGSKRLKQVTIQTSSSYAQMQLNGFEIVVDSVKVAEVTNNGTTLAGNLTTTGSISASTFYGDGSHLTGMPTFSQISGITGGLTQLNNSFVNVGGDTMTGTLVIQGSGANLLDIQQSISNGIVSAKFGNPTHALTLGSNSNFLNIDTSGSNAIIDIKRAGTSRLTISGNSILSNSSVGQFAIQGTTESTSTTTGVLQVAGGAGFIKNVHIGGTATCYSDLILPSISGAGIKVDTTTPTYPWHDKEFIWIPDIAGGDAPNLATFRDDGGGLTVRSFTYSVGDRMDAFIHIPHDWAPGTDLYLHVHWAHNGTTISGDMIWKANYTMAKGHNQQDFGTVKTQNITYATVNIATTPRYRHRIDEVQLSNNGGTGNLLDTAQIEIDGVIMLSLLATTIPTIGGGTTAPFLITTDLHYQSTNIGTKNKSPNFYA